MGGIVLETYADKRYAQGKDRPCIPEQAVEGIWDYYG